jgi:hypothetical protein
MMENARSSQSTAPHGPDAMVFRDAGFTHRSLTRCRRSGELVRVVAPRERSKNRLAHGVGGVDENGNAAFLVRFQDVYDAGLLRLGVQQVLRSASEPLGGAGLNTSRSPCMRPTYVDGDVAPSPL